VRRRYRVEYLPLAVRDLTEIIDYIARDRPAAARTLIDRIDRAVGRLAMFPRAGKRPNDARLRQMGYRMLVVRDYLVFYLIVGRSVQIRRIVHGVRRYDFLLSGE
jgi:addiction module RelE/StbE family toxin